MKNMISSREQEVIQLIAQEYSMQDIAKELYLSYHTITSHRKNILAKLKVRNTAGMIRRAFELGILKVSVVAYAA